MAPRLTAKRARTIYAHLTFVILILAFLSGCASSRSVCLNTKAVSEARNPETVLFFVGDAGDSAVDDAVLSKLRSEIDYAREQLDQENVLTVFLGDNLYEHGVPPDAVSLDDRRVAPLLAQAEASHGSRAFFVLGNHDWANGRTDGRAAAETQIRLLEEYASSTARQIAVLPGRDCPAPVHVDVGESARLIFLETQFWLHPGEDKSSDFCTKGEPVKELWRLVGSAGSRRVLVFAHHPLRSQGPHGGAFSPRQHLFPLTDKVSWLYLPAPLLGTFAVTVLRPHFTHQDLSSARYGSMRTAILSGAAQEAEIFAWVSGHEHNLQILQGDETIRYHLISGSGSLSRRSPVRCRRNVLLGAPHNGFVKVTIDRDGDWKATAIHRSKEGSWSRHPVPLPLDARKRGR